MTWRMGNRVDLTGKSGTVVPPAATLGQARGAAALVVLGLLGAPLNAIVLVALVVVIFLLQVVLDVIARLRQPASRD